MGSQPITQSGTGTTNQSTATLLRTQTVELKTTASNTAFILPASVGVNREVLVVQTDTTGGAAVVFPPVGGQINALAVNASYPIAAINKPAIFWQYKKGFWTVLQS